MLQFQAFVHRASEARGTERNPAPSPFVTHVLPSEVFLREGMTKRNNPLDLDITPNATGILIPLSHECIEPLPLSIRHYRAPDIHRADYTKRTDKYGVSSSLASLARKDIFLLTHPDVDRQIERSRKTGLSARRLRALLQLSTDSRQPLTERASRPIHR